MSIPEEGIDVKCSYLCPEALKIRLDTFVARRPKLTTRQVILELLEAYLDYADEH